MNLCYYAAFPAGVGSMGLLERRAAKAFQEGPYPSLRQRIEEAAGHEVAIEIDWSSLQTADYGQMYDEAWPKVYFEPLIEALQAIAIDDLGRDALREGLKTIRIRDSGTQSVSLTDGELLLDFAAVANLDYGDERRKTIQDTLERGL